MEHNLPRKEARLITSGDGSTPFPSAHSSYFNFMQITVKVFDMWGDHTDKLRQEVLDAFKMEIPDHVILYFPPALVEKMKAVEKVANDLSLRSVKFGLTNRESEERAKITPYTKDGVEIQNTTYEEHGVFKTLDEFYLSYDWFSQTFSAHFYYSCSWWEMNFDTKRFTLEAVIASEKNSANLTA